MRILLIHSFWHSRGGDTTAVALQRAALLARGHTIIPFGMRHPDNEPEPGDAAWPGWVDPAAPPGLGQAFEGGRAASRLRVRPRPVAK